MASERTMITKDDTFLPNTTLPLFIEDIFIFKGKMIRISETIRKNKDNFLF